MNESNYGNAINKILVVKPSSLGDIIHSFPAINLLIQEYPNIKIDWLINPEFEPILDYCPNINERIIFQRKKLGSIKTGFGTFISLIKKIRNNQYDFVLDLQGLIRSAFFARIAKSKKIIGFAECKESIAKLFYNKKFYNIDNYSHAIDKNISLICQLLEKPSIQGNFILKANPAINLSIEQKLEVASIHKKDILIGIIPGARWKTKTWPPEFFTKVINALYEYNNSYKFILIGSKADEKIAKSIIADAISAKNIISMIGKTTLPELVELIRNLDVIFTNDSGPMHIAAALGKPVFALFGSTDPDKTGPYGSDNIIFTPNLECVKCFKRYCPTGANKCHESIDVKNVVNKITKRLEQNVEN